MKVNIFKIMIFLALAGFLASCDDDFLDTKPIAAASPETFYTTVESADMAITTCYSMFKVEKVWDLTVLMTFGSIASDEAEAGAGGKGDVVQFQNIDQLRHTPSEAQVFEQTWGYMYRAITACNVALDAIPNIPEYDDVSPAEQEILDARMGEAYFLRAFNYFYLTTIYGGVPLVDRVLSPEEYAQPRAEIAEVMDLIKSDLLKAIDRLPTKSEWGSSNVGRASKGAALAMLGKTYLYEASYAKNYAGDSRFAGLEQHWDSAAYYLDQVIAMDDYELVGSEGETFTTWRDPADAPGTTPAWRWIFMTQGNNSAEGVFEIQSRNDGLGWFISRGNALCTWCAPRVLETGDGGTLSFGWGWWCPTDFLDASFEDGDPREDYTILDVSDSVLHVTNGWLKPNFDDLEGGTGLTRNSHKYEVGPDEVEVGPSNWPMGPINLKVIRIADVYLMAAEAHLEDGNSTIALEYVNAVRTRARLSGNTGVPADLGSVTLEDIVNERLYELSMEGHRFFDLVRWGLANQYLDHTLADGDQIEFVEGLHEFFPLPSQEILQSGGLLEQYPGWN